MSILSTNKKLISIGSNYSAGSGIEIDDYVISLDPTLSGVIDDKLNTSDFETYSAGVDSDIQYVSANAGKTYSAGENIGISENYVISSKDWTTDIANASSNAYEQATALIPPEFDPTYMSGAIEQNAGDIQYISGVAITAHQDLSYISGAVDNKLDATAFNLPNSAKWNESTNVVETNSAAWFDNVGDAEVNNFVYTNSATINDVDTSYIQNSGTFLTAHQVIPSAKWEDASVVVQSNSAQWSENTGDEEVNNAVYNNSAKWNDISVYQTNSANYLTAHQDISNKLDTTAFSDVSGSFLTAINIPESATWNDVSTTVQSNSADWASHQDLSYISGQVDNKLDITAFNLPNSAKWNEIEVYEQNSATYLTAHQDISNKLDTTAFSTVSGTFLTAHQDISNKLDTTAFSTVSGTFLTAHQDLSYISGQVDNKLDTTAFSTVSGNFLTAVDLTPYYTTADANTMSSMLSGAIDYVSANAGDEFPASANEAITAYQNASGTYLTAHQPISANEWNSVYETVETNSGSWTGGTSVDTIPVAVISPLVTGFSGESAYLGIESTALNLSSYVPVSSIGYNGGCISTISGKTISSYTGRYAMTANYANTAGRAYQDRNYNEITSYYQPKLNIVGDAGTITAINGSAVGATIPEGWELVAGQGIEIVDDSVNNQTTISVTAAGGNPEVESYVQTNSASIDDVVSTYEANSGSYITQETDWTNTITAASSYAYSEAVAQIPAPFDPTYMSGAIDQNASDIQYISSVAITAHQDISNKLDTTAFSDVSGSFLTAVNIPESADWEDATTAYQTNSGNYLTAHQPISANEWNSNYDTVNTNSATWNEVTGKENTLTFEYSGASISSINGSALLGESIPFEIYGISAGDNIGIWEQNNALWISGKDWSNDFYAKTDTSSKTELDAAIGNIESLLASL